jgi:AcrR family transcriptional regulator
MALGEPVADRRTARREATKAEIVDAAWELVRVEGLAALSLRELAAKVGMQPPSLYSYFSSKSAIYDAMFLDGYRQLQRYRTTVELPNDPRQAVHLMARTFLEFCTADPARYQLLFQRTVPGFEPSADSYSVAVDVLDATRQALAAAGATEAEHVDLYTALLTGLVDQQISNDPGGDRWARLLDEAIDMYLDHVAPPRRKRK